ncbi:DNA sulfur modification protein DndB [Micromonospora sp. RTGN7]|uniref:DNA sulfur modification protein DndB n=1 Tax=Micromonospora sp. RTGN7 TaxID=3016526 RepID=UPI0029FF4861|nr:DNA sulfur modification protein DndB [Micromonospora sp. RTGN7]
MSNEALKPITTGFPIIVMQVRDHVAIGIVDIENLLHMVNDPAKVEQEAARDTKARQEVDGYARMRAEVQRVIGTAASPKSKNITSYADYIAEGLTGALDDAWSIPPVTLWSPRPLEIQPDGKAFLPIRDGLIAIDGETQITALHRIKKQSSLFGLRDFDFAGAMVAFELYHGISTLSARQIFHDRNLKGVPVDKSLALSMDMRDFATSVTQALVDSTTVIVDGEETALGDLILTGKRQVGPKSREWMTLSGLRTLVVTTILGKAGIHAASGDVESSNLPEGTDMKAVKHETVERLSALLKEYADQFHAKSAITSPAVLAGLGASVHRSMPWCTTDKLTEEKDLANLLFNIRWEREAMFWGGIAAKETGKGVSWAGGARDSGHKVYEAINNLNSDIGLKIRGLTRQP